MAEEGLFKTGIICYDFNYRKRRNGYIEKWIVRLDLARQIGPDAIFGGILISYGGCYSCRDINCLILFGDGGVF